MNRFYVDPRDIDTGNGTIRIVNPQEIRHLTKVLRLRPGEEIFVSDGQGGGYTAVFPASGPDELLLSIRQAWPRQRREDRRVRLTVACAVPKYTRFEEVIDKGTQLEAEAIVPLITVRTQAALSSLLKKKERWERLRLAAAKQSGALFLPSLRPPVPFDAFLDGVQEFDLCLIPHLAEQTQDLRGALSGFAGRLCVMIGPEGDFTPEEIRRAVQAGCRSVSLGESVLRVDTAAIAVMSFVRLAFGR